MKACSSREAAKRLGVSLMTLRRCIADGNWIKAPKLRTVGGVKVLRWSDRDVERVHRLMKSLKLSGPAYIGTMPFKVFEQLFRHPRTDNGLESFPKDLENARTTLSEIGEPA